jgi:hypothetical protein
VRDAGWTVKNVAGAVIAMWVGIIGLGSIETNDQLYYQQSSGGASVNVQLTGQVNQAVQIFKDDDGDGNTAEGSDFDRRTYFKLFGREQGQLYGLSQLSDIGLVTMAAQAYRFPISTGADLKITHTDVQIDADSNGTADVAPYSGMSITYYATGQNVALNFSIPKSQGTGVRGVLNFWTPARLCRALGDLGALLRSQFLGPRNTTGHLRFIFGHACILLLAMLACASIHEMKVQA